MGQNATGQTVRKIMMEFADATGLLSDGVPPRRYLWTDAFAVCNFLELYRESGEERYKQLALYLVDQVHEILGKHRGDDRRRGRISGLDEREGALHPTRGGLRIGKAMNERGPADPYDDELEWDRDGQYYHYLTKWMHALSRVSRITADPVYNRWAVELAKTVHARFTYSIGGWKRMYWKMSIDLTRPLVPSMGHHDPLDGLITCLELKATQSEISGSLQELDLNLEIADMAKMCEGMNWATSDLLGAGELLSLAYRLAQVKEGLERPDLLNELPASARPGLQSFERENQRKLPADYRLAFRELGLSIGLHAVERMRALIGKNPDLKSGLQAGVKSLTEYLHLSDAIETFWLDPANRQTASWTEHRDINAVMLATSLAPDGYLSV